MNDSSPLSLAFLEQHPATAALLLQEFPPEQAVDFLKQLSAPALIPVIGSMASWPAARTLSLLKDRLAADVLRGLPPADAETLLRLLPTEQRIAFLKHMPRGMAKSFTRKLAFPISAVGAWMDTTVPYFPNDSSVKHCLDLVKRRQSHLGGVIIVVDNKRHLTGMVEVEKLLTCDGERQLSDLLNRDIDPLPARATLWEVQEHPGWTRFPTLPVIDRNNLLLGALTYSALKAGTAKSAHQPDNDWSFILVMHLGKAFLVALSGLLLLVSSHPDHSGQLLKRVFPGTNDSLGGEGE